MNLGQLKYGALPETNVLEDLCNPLASIFHMRHEGELLPVIGKRWFSHHEWLLWCNVFLNVICVVPFGTGPGHHHPMVDPHEAMMHHPYLTVGGNIVQVVSEIILMQKKIKIYNMTLRMEFLQ